MQLLLVNLLIFHQVKIMLRVCRDSSLESPSGQEYLRVDENQKHLSVFVPSHPKERNTALAPKVYAFDAVFTEKNSLVGNDVLLIFESYSCQHLHLRSVIGNNGYRIKAASKF